MGAIKLPPPVLSVMAVFSRYDHALGWAIARAEAAWGRVALQSATFDFENTDYYEKAMGSGLKKVLVAFEPLFDPAQLVERKHESNDWEAAYRAESTWPEPRPLNVDPGYLTLAKLVLASTKDRDHRIYIGQGIYAEGTLFFQHGRWQTRPWTYPDYQQMEYHAFFDRCRDYLRQSYQTGQDRGA